MRFQHHHLLGIKSSLIHYLLTLTLKKRFLPGKLQSGVCHFVIDSSGNYFLKISHSNSSILAHHLTKINLTQSNNACIYSRNSLHHI